jgi:hypothetical protein
MQQLTSRRKITGWKKEIGYKNDKCLPVISSEFMKY